MTLQNLIILPLLGILILSVIPNYQVSLIKRLALTISLIIFIYSLFLYFTFDIYAFTYQHYSIFTF